MPDAAFLRQKAQEADFVLAADGGANTAAEAGIKPDAIIGDLDSVSASTRLKFQDVKQLFIDNQNNTDLEKALDYLTTQHFTHCTIVGATGNRLDFTIGNLLSVFRYKLAIMFEDETCRLFPITRTTAFTTHLGARVSILPIGPADGLTLTGLQYPLKNVNLEVGQTGLSNVALSAQIEVEFKRGHLLVYIEK